MPAHPSAPPPAPSGGDEFTDAERRLLAPHVTSVDGPVFALRNLPEPTRAALFARYSRSSRSLRRLLLDEFVPGGAIAAAGEADAEAAIGAARARDLFARILTEYGDDSVAQLAGAHVACEGVSNLCTKVLERGRFGAYLEQSTRYVSYADRPGGRFRYHLPEEVVAAGLEEPFRTAMDRAFTTYAEMVPRLRAALDAAAPAAPDPVARRRAIRAAALDAARGVLPVAATANVGIVASAQAYEALLLRCRVHPLAEVRGVGEAIRRALLEVIPDFLVRLDQPERGGARAEYLRAVDRGLAEAAGDLLPAAAGPDGEAPPEAAGGALRPSVRLLRYEPDGERDVLAAALFPHAGCALDAVRRCVDGLDDAAFAQAFARVVGPRQSRRDRPGRGLEQTAYVFEIVCDYGAFRDLQRHRPATLSWQRLGPELGVSVPELVDQAGVRPLWDGAISALETLHALVAERAPDAAPYALALGHRVRWQLACNAREAMHLIELRSQPQGHPEYRRVAQAMLGAIRDVAGHRHLADAMRFADLGPPGPADIGRLAAETRLAGRRGAAGGPAGDGREAVVPA